MTGIYSCRTQHVLCMQYCCIQQSFLYHTSFWLLASVQSSHCSLWKQELDACGLKVACAPHAELCKQTFSLFLTQ